MKLTKRFLFIPLLLIIFISLFFSAYNTVKNRTLREFEVQQSVLAQQASTGIESFFIYYQRELTFLSKIQPVTNLTEEGKDMLAEFYNDNSDLIEAVSLVDVSGILRYTYPYNSSAIDRDISAQNHVKEIMSTQKPTVSEVFTSVQGFRAIAYHVPIFRNNKYDGSIAILISLNKLSQIYLEKIKTFETGYAMMSSKEGVVLYNPFNEQNGISVSEFFKNFPTVLDIIKSSNTGSEGSGICYFPIKHTDSTSTVRTISCFFRVPLVNTFWTITIFTPENEVLGKLQSFRNRLYLLFSLILVVVTLYFYLSLKATNILKEEKKRREVEKTLLESEKRFRAMFELSPSGIILIDKNGEIIEANSSFCKSLGYQMEELKGQNIRIFANPSSDFEIETNISTLLAGNTLNHEVSNHKKDGTISYFDLYETMIIFPDGNPGILSVSNDITERKKAQFELILAKEKAEESDRLKSAFLANISHELRTPLNAIIGFSSLIQDSSNDATTSSYSKIIEESGTHLLGLVEDLLDISMIETGQMKIRNEVIDIGSLLQEVKNIIDGEKIIAAKDGIEIILKNENLPVNQFLNVDARKLKQVLINLLKNSLKFTDSGYIEFGYRPMEIEGTKFVCFYVNDTGIGIEQKFHNSIFELFRQIDDSHTRQFGGTGIGLSIVKKIVSLFGGEIWLQSEPGKGSTFFFTVPEKPVIDKSKTIAD